jgi:hypothetical protein
VNENKPLKAVTVCGAAEGGKRLKIQKYLCEKKVITSPPKITKVITFGTGLAAILSLRGL